MTGSPNTTPKALAESVREWRHALTILITFYFVFETVSGLFVQFAPFGTTAQVTLIGHTLVGVVILPFYLWYQVRHWWRLRPKPLSYIKFLGYALLVVFLINAWTGAQLTYEGFFARRISWTADRLHLISGYATGVLLLVHYVAVILLHRRLAKAAGVVDLARAPGVHLKWCGALMALSVILTLGVSWWLPGERDPYQLPEDYSYRYGENPFAPSQARSETGGPLDPVVMANSRSCGTSGCHEEILEEWLPSAHRYSAMDGAFQRVQHVMAKNEGPEATRYCAGCHDPIALFSGAKNLYNDDLTSFGADEGISCVACHSIATADVQGNADYVMLQPERYLGELESGGLGKVVSNFLIRTYPRHHVKSFKRDLYKTPEFCGACHKQFIDQRINKASWVQLQNQYDNWKASHWNAGDSPQTRITCNECHMRLVASNDPGAGDDADYNRSPDDGRHRHHGFIGANQFIPAFHKLKGWKRHVALTEEWLKGETVVPEIQDKWRSGPVVPLRIEAPEAVRAGESFPVKVVIHSNKVGHDFPTGPLDIIQCWVQLEVKDADGKEIYSSGRLDDRGFLQEGSFLFKAEGIDKQGNLIDRHNLWEMVGARFRRALFPDYTDTAKYQVLCPSTSLRTDVKKALPEEEVTTLDVPAGVKGPLTVEARLNYRKFNQFLVSYLLGSDEARAPLTSMTTVTKTIQVTTEP
ncbi:MAG TPA: hypothetical protein ENK43_16330 [Planctomycetes bacterium]|nr:hypothetical protein [Planctomycetota bacterium]